jgi:hypothetical protein
MPTLRCAIYSPNSKKPISLRNIGDIEIVLFLGAYCRFSGE